MDGIKTLINELIEDCKANELMREDVKKEYIKELEDIKRLYHLGFYGKIEALKMIAGCYEED